MSLSEHLNALDGVGAQHGRLVFMTTNDVGSLDAALVRPGRCDRTVELGNADASMAARLFASFYREAEDQGTVADLAARFGAAIAGESGNGGEGRSWGGSGGAGGWGAGVGRGSDGGGSQSCNGGGASLHSMAALQGLLLRTRGDPHAALQAALDGTLLHG